MIIKHALQLENSDDYAYKAYRLYHEVYAEHPDHPIHLLKRTQQDFQPETLLLALSDNMNDVIGVMICDPSPDFDNALAQGIDIQSKLKQGLQRQSLDNIFTISALAVDKQYREQGVASSLYENALKISQNKCIAVLLAANQDGGRIARKFGFKDVPGCSFSSNYRLETDKPVLDASGKHVCQWSIISTLTP